MNTTATPFRTLLFSAFILFGLVVFAQQQPMYTQYMFNTLAVNPAYAGSHESISATALSRIQWVGVDGAPNTHTFSIHSPVPGRKIAIGAMFSHDQIGVSKQTTAQLSYAYRIQMKRSTLSLGLQGGIRSNRTNYNELGVNDTNLQGSEFAVRPNFGVGAYYYTGRCYLGVSVPTVIKNNWSKASDENQVIGTDIPHFFITAGMLIDISPLVKIKPSTLIKSVQGAPVEIDINANVILDDKVWVGLSYRSFDALSMILELQVNPQLRFGYAYDLTVSDLRQVNSGSHELMLNYRFVYERTKIVTPRYF
ncbi:PorP/SprF family type IX secretion system membrane protein [Marinoscillum furvescens]|uniref:Type IX secretion system PorP/SprF family membrane protein n=1 Tax=Marinoscillum furvescens DSM 4134 TaxID=1122208 RepID=A0A3D9L2Z2_MARFU|nr:type IX secretion system membrane protein PorP/SprF [Marinoscillum furvescens]RED97428.1 type IX secretion system PorP/SprF family membrane protein [Marinoscillum furvescens DSM 4134]